MSQFQSYRWIGTRPEHFDFEGTQLLLLSEKSTFEEVMERSHAAGDNGGLVMEEMEDLEEDVKSALQRAGGRDESAAIFNELEVRAKDYPKLQTEF